DKDLRGRAPGEVAQMLCRVASMEAPGGECRVVLDETEAFAEELQQLGEGDVLVMFYDNLAPILELLESYGARPTAAIEEHTAAHAANAAGHRTSLSGAREEVAAQDAKRRREHYVWH
ncbi:MAG TPA: hypothetical protein VGV59_08645, partial [Pyrinomonadaceae bacterium]|nr:hypothetical protein [Pyrinomonadaceae bacterium]